MKLGSCYRTAYQFLVVNPNAILAHGIITNPSGRVICHGWIEFRMFGQWFVLDLSIQPPVQADRKFYYKTYKVRNIHRYVFKEAHRLAQESDLFGPWDYQSLKHLRDTETPAVSESTQSKEWQKKLFAKHKRSGGGK